MAFAIRNVCALTSQNISHEKLAVRTILSAVLPRVMLSETWMHIVLQNPDEKGIFKCRCHLCEEGARHPVTGSKCELGFLIVYHSGSVACPVCVSRHTALNQLKQSDLTLPAGCYASGPFALRGMSCKHDETQSLPRSLERDQGR